MSCFVVDDLTIHRIAPVVYGRLYPLPKELDKVGKDLLAMNVDAYRARYGRKADDCDQAIRYFYSPDVNWDAKCSLVQQLKSLDCFLYQCSEGDVPKRELFGLCVDARERLAEHILVGAEQPYNVRETAEYNDAVWG